MHTLTQKRLKETLHYNSKIGIFTWRKSTARRIKAGDIAGTKYDNRYIQIGIDGKQYRAHMLAWLYVHGYFPEHEIDHINRVPSDNRILNLREISHICNSKNNNEYSSNSSGVTGVCRTKRGNNWRAYITSDRTVYRLGQYKDFDEAVAHRLAAEQCLNWHGCNSSSSAYKYSLRWRT